METNDLKVSDTFQSKESIRYLSPLNEVIYQQF